ncbi:MAG: hypothetical protein ABIJ16_01615 [Bacteroidota bacterium]
MKSSLFFIFILLIFSCRIAISQADSVSYAYHPDKDAKEAVAKIMKYTGLEPDFLIIEGTVSTVVAYIRNNKRYIEYNPDFIKRVRNMTRTDWAAVSVLAHEIGHHLLGHTLRYKGTNPGNELAADKFSGYILYQMGASLEETVAAIKSVGCELDTIFHPPQSARIEAITNGWLQARQLSEQKAYMEFQDSAQSTRLVYHYKCTFKGDENIYFVDENDKIIWFDNYGKVVVLGFRQASDRKEYAWIYRYGDAEYYVDRSGDIWNVTSYGSVFKIGTAEKMSGK